MEDSPKAPAGWYPVRDGEMRYWDGSAWTDFTSQNYWNRRHAPTAAKPTTGTPEPRTPPLHRKWQSWAVVAVLGVAGLSAIGQSDGPATDTVTATSGAATPPRTTPSAPDPAPTETASRTPKPAPTPTQKLAALLFMTDQKDGDSFVASDGNEYRLGLVNTAEASEPCGAAAARFTRDFLEEGFSVDAYSQDSYDRRVAEVFDKSGRSLNVALAQSGYGDDRYLNQFRYENPDLARRLDAAFASADTPPCLASAPAPLVQQPKPSQEPGGNCMTGYDPCLPVRGDMNCPEVGHPVRVTGNDPYGLDRDGDGVGCD